jgi:hypothetical protein
MMRKINREKKIEGTKIPGIIYNCHYYYADIEVYEDGMVNCWELVDLDGLKEKLNSNWLVPYIPEKGQLSIFGLGYYCVKKAKWSFNKNSYYKYIKKTIKCLNPNFKNIYKISKEEKELLSIRRVKYSPTPSEFYVKNELGYQTVEGKGFNIFFKNSEKNYLTNLVVYKNGKITCFCGENSYDFHIDTIEKNFNDGTFFTSFEIPTSVSLGALGLVTFNEVISSIDIKEKYKELLGNYEKMNDNETAFDKCRNVYFEYLQDPSEELRRELKRLYEMIPEHQRVYLGNMDTRDTDYRRIIYSPNLKREV